MYRFMYQKCEMQREVVNWASLAKKLLNDLGLSQVWQQQSCSDNNLFLNIIMQTETTRPFFYNHGSLMLIIERWPRFTNISG